MPGKTNLWGFVSLASWSLGSMRTCFSCLIVSGISVHSGFALLLLAYGSAVCHKLRSPQCGQKTKERSRYLPNIPTSSYWVHFLKVPHTPSSTTGWRPSLCYVSCRMIIQIQTVAATKCIHSIFFLLHVNLIGIHVLWGGHQGWMDKLKSGIRLKKRKFSRREFWERKDEEAVSASLLGLLRCIHELFEFECNYKAHFDYVKRSGTRRELLSKIHTCRSIASAYWKHQSCSWHTWAV